MPIERVNQVWIADITYIPVSGGWVYLVAVKDWYSRFIVSWELSNSMEVSFCLAALERALAQQRPEIFNGDQGAQCTSPRFTDVLKAAEVRVSMDGKGRYLDHIWVERFWRTLKYEEVYLNEYATPLKAWQRLDAYIEYFNHQRAHSSLNHATPSRGLFRSPATSRAT